MSTFFDSKTYQNSIKKNALPRINTGSFLQAQYRQGASPMSSATAFPVSSSASFTNSPTFNFLPENIYHNQMFSPMVSQFIQDMQLTNQLQQPILFQGPNSQKQMRGMSPLKNYACTMCDKSYVRSHDLKRHQRAYHFGGPRYPCEMCGTLFSRSDALKRHAKDKKCLLKKEKKEAQKAKKIRLPQSNYSQNQFQQQRLNLQQISPPISIPDYFEQQKANMQSRADSLLQYKDSIEPVVLSLDQKPIVNATANSSVKSGVPINTGVLETIYENAYQSSDSLEIIHDNGSSTLLGTDMEYGSSTDSFIADMPFGDSMGFGSYESPEFHSAFFPN